MPFHAVFISDEQLARVRADADLDFSASTEAIRQLALNPKLKRGMRLVLDLREASLVLSSEETENLARLHADLLCGHRMALLVSRPVDFGVVRMMAAYASIDGAAIMPLHDEAEALEWLRT